MLHCGICIGDERLYKFRDSIPQNDIYPGIRAAGLPTHSTLVMTQIPSEAVTSCHVGKTFVHWYTDGSTVHGKSPLLARSGWAAFVATGSRHNVSSLLHGPSQSTYRAELRAFLHVIRYTTVNVIIRSDCKAVVNTAMAIINKESKTLEDIINADIAESDLWQQLVFEIANSRDRRIKRQSMLAHLDDHNQTDHERAQQNTDLQAQQKRLERIATANARRDKYLNKGTVNWTNIWNNQEVDKSAKNAASHNLPPKTMIEFAKDRKTITRAVQDILYEVWTAHTQRVCGKQINANTTTTEQDDHESEALSSNKPDNDYTHEDYDPFMGQQFAEVEEIPQPAHDDPPPE